MFPKTSAMKQQTLSLRIYTRVPSLQFTHASSPYVLINIQYDKNAVLYDHYSRKTLRRQ